MNRSPELFRRRGRRVVPAKVRVVRFIAVCAPIPLELPRVRIDDDDPLVTVSIGHVGLVRAPIDKDLCDTPEVLQIVAAGSLALPSELHQKLAAASELQNV